MSRTTPADFIAVRDSCERAAAELLGRILFEFSRLDMALGLCVAWTDQGRNIDDLTIQVRGWSFYDRLDYLRRFLTRTRENSAEDRKAYEAWIADADVSRQLRNEMVHGRWGIDATGSKVINVVGLPTSSLQSERSYSIRELKAFVDSLKVLQQRLSELRDLHPL